MAAFLAVGYILADVFPLSAATFPVLLLVDALLLVALFWLRRGRLAILALSLFFLVLGLLRAPLPDVSLLPDGLRVWSIALSHTLVDRLRTVGLEADGTALLEAMLLGQRGEVGEATRELYRLSGASHILALSGLHLGVLFGLFHFWLMRLLGYRWRYVFGWLGIVLMWGYALLTGFPASLCRASVMMSLMFLGAMRLGGTDSWHNLGLAAFLLLLFSPASLRDVGFQLSFMAVAALLLVYPMLTALWQPQGHLLRWLWQGVAVSFAAQMGVLPLLLHYFGYVSLSGIVLSPFYVLLATAIIYAALLLLVLRWLGMGAVLCPVVMGLIHLQHGMMSLAVRLPFDRVVAATFPWSRVVLLYVALLCLLPPLHALRREEADTPVRRLARFFRLWPYLLSSLLILTVLALAS